MIPNIQSSKIKKSAMLFILHLSIVSISTAQTITVFKYTDIYCDKIDFYEYKSEITTIDDIAQKFTMTFKDTPKDSVYLISKIDIFSKNGNYSLVKVNDSKIAKSVVFVFLDNVQVLNLPICFNVVSKLQIRSFIEFYSSKDNPDFPEINKSKPLVKNENGLLDLYKLSDIIEKNQVILSKYIN